MPGVRPIPTMPKTVAELDAELNRALQDQRVLDAFEIFLPMKWACRRTPASHVMEKTPIESE